MPKNQQLAFFNLKQQMSFGGSSLKGRRKSKRPLSTKHSIHMSLQADRAVLRQNERLILATWNNFARKFGVRTYKFSVNSNHLHALFRIHSRAMYARFIQALSGTLARKLKLKWSARPFTRLVTWGKAFERAKNYVEMNIYEAMGFIDHQPRGRGSLKRRPWYSGATT